MYYGGAHQTTGKAGFSISQFSEKKTPRLEMYRLKVRREKSSVNSKSFAVVPGPAVKWCPKSNAFHRGKYSCASPEVFVTLQTAQPLTNRNSVQMRQSNLVECQYVHGRRYQSHPR
ncbi:hypothetical protein quinque_007785 [Culex quinquefasciatus]